MQGSAGQSYRLQRIKAISFDGDMTLWDFEAVMRHSLGRALAELHWCLPESLLADLTIDRMIEIRDTVAEELQGQSLNLEHIRLEAFVRALHIIGVRDPDLAAHINAVYLKHRFQDIRTYCPFSTLFNIGMSSGWCRMGTAILSGAVSRDASGLRCLPAIDPPVRFGGTEDRTQSVLPTPIISGIDPGLRRDDSVAGSIFSHDDERIARRRSAMNDGRDSDRRAGHLPEGMTRR
jgi:hypothetical protein